MRRLDVLLIHPGNRQDTYQGLAAEFAAVEPPIWAGLLASFLRVKGLEVRILDTNLEQLGYADAADVVKHYNPLLTAIICYGHQPSASTLVMPGAGALAKSIKEIAPGLPVILLGGHVAALPERTLLEEACDFACDGEGPYTLYELALALSQVGAKWQDADFSRVRGLLYEENGRIRHTKSAPLVMDLDNDMPGVALDLLEPQRYRTHNWHSFGRLEERNGYGAIYTSLGCPFSCDFCCIQAPFKSGEKVLGKKRTHRLWSMETVLSQIELLTNKYGIRSIKIADELFLMDNNTVKQILRELIRRNYGLHMWANTRLDTYTPELLELAREAGIEWLPLSIESANDKVLRSVHKGTHVYMASKAREDFRAAGIHAMGHLLFGLPEDDVKTMQQTLDLAEDLNCEFANIFSAMAYPGSKLHERAMQGNWRLPESWSGYSQHGYDSFPLDTKYISGKEVLAFRDQAFQHYFTRASYLDMMEKKFGLDTRQHLERMTRYRLRRRYFETEAHSAI